ncbi:MAG: hypothetical protein GY927_01855 [bacterium]|nr:hypothetical protein [bacterium]
MSRIRTIKPEFFNSYDVACLTPLSRLFYAYLWTESDRAGLLDWKPNNFRMRFFPTDGYDINEIAGELIKQGLVIIHDIDGDKICEIPGFTKHQVINNRESDSLLASRVDDACKRVKAEGRKEGKEGKGKEGASKTRKTSIPNDFEISERVREWAKEKGHTRIEEHLEAFKLQCQSKNYQYTDWDSAFMGAVRKNWASLDVKQNSRPRRPLSND